MISRIKDYRDTFGTLYRKSRNELVDLAKTKKLAGYSKLRKQELIDELLHHKRIKPFIKKQKQLFVWRSKSYFKNIVEKEGIERAGQTKQKMVDSIVKYRINTHLNNKHKVNSSIKDVSILKPYPLEEALKRAFRSYRINGLEKTDVDTYLKMVKMHIMKLLKEQVKDLGSIKVQLSLWIRWAKLGEPESPDDVPDNILTDKPFNSLMMEVFSQNNI